MVLVSNDPSWWPVINAHLIGSYFILVGCAGVMYDWGLTFGREVELIWRQRWSLMTFLYLSVRYAGIGYAVVDILVSVPTIPLTDGGCLATYGTAVCMGEVVDVLLGVIMITRLHAMYQRSRKVLIFLVVIFLAITIIDVVIVAIIVVQASVEESILSGLNQCIIGEGDSLFLSSVSLALSTVREVIALCLAVRIAVKHFRELRQHSTGGIMDDLFVVLMKNHVIYFASFLAFSCLHLSLLSPKFSSDSYYSLDTQIYNGLEQTFQVVTMFVLGPRLILGIREHHAELVANSDTATAMTSIAFQERIHVSTNSSV